MSFLSAQGQLTSAFSAPTIPAGVALTANTDEVLLTVTPALGQYVVNTSIALAMTNATIFSLSLTYGATTIALFELANQVTVDNATLCVSGIFQSNGLDDLEVVVNTDSGANYSTSASSLVILRVV
jgi:hypothetical protein